MHASTGAAHVLGFRLRYPAEAATHTHLRTACSARAQTPRPGLRTPRALAAALAVLAGLALAAPVHAQTSVKLVGNTTQTESSTTSDSTKDRAQAFDTGDNETGYTLTAVKVQMAQAVLTSVLNTLTAHVFLADDTTGHPTGSSLGTFSNPSELLAGPRTFTAHGDGIELDANERYVFVMDTSQSCGTNVCAHVKRTAADAEDTGAATGWSITDAGLERNADNSGGWSSTGTDSLMVEVHGYANAPLPPPLPTALTNTALVSNMGQSAGTQTFLGFSQRLAQAFTTGGDSDDPGFKLTRVDLRIVVTGAGPDFSVSVHAADGLNPGTSLRTLSPPASIVSGENTFTAPGGIDLAANTTYFVVVVPTGTSNANYKWFGGAARFGEDPGKAAGWSIADNSRFNTGSVWRASTVGGVNIANQMAIHGYVKEATAPKTAPSITSVTAGAAATAAGSLTVNWSAPTDDGGSGVIDYDLRYCEGTTASACEGKWVGEDASTGIPDPAGTDTSATITGLKPATGYLVQVRAANIVGAGPWSDLRDPPPNADTDGPTVHTTNSATGTNNAPRVVESQSGTNLCKVKADLSTPVSTLSMPTGTLVSLAQLVTRKSSDVDTNGDPLPWSGRCTGTNRIITMFDDQDGDPLTISFKYTLPDNVRWLQDPVLIGPVHTAAPHNDEGALRFRGATAFKATEVRVDVTATDPRGASATTHVIIRGGTILNTSAPRFDKAAGLLRFAQGTKGAKVLPPASGGDFHSLMTQPYFYAVTGLPPGLWFDPETRQVFGTPTTAGIWTATYTAEDADSNASADRNPVIVDPSDTASQTFTIRVEPQASTTPTIDLVRVVSAPTYDSDNNGVFDTYVRRDKILFDVEFSEPVEVTYEELRHIRLRIDLGVDDNNLGNSRKTAGLESVLNGGRTLRFAYTVATSDRDADGVWVQTVNLTNDFRMIFLAGTPTATITSAESGIDADVTKSGLPTRGGRLEGAVRAKVDGSKDNDDRGPVPETATVNGATLTVTFNKALDTSVDTSALVWNLEVQGVSAFSGGNRNLRMSPNSVGLSNDGTNGVMTLSLPMAARTSDAVTLTHVFGDAGQILRGTDGKKAPAFRDLEVTNTTPGVPGPRPVRASVAGTALKLVFDQALDATSQPPGSAFRVFTQEHADRDTRDIGGSSTGINGDTVTVTLAAAVRPDEIVWVTYVKPASNMLMDSVHYTEASSFDRFRVETVEDITGPAFSGAVFIQDPMTSTVTKWTLYYDEALDTSSVPAAADFAVGSGATLRSIAVANNAVTFEASVNTPTMALSYTPPATGGIRDLAGNPAAKIDGVTYSRSTASNNPVAQAGDVDGATLRLRFSEALDPGSIPAASAFTLVDPDDRVYVRIVMC